MSEQSKEVVLKIPVSVTSGETKLDDGTVLTWQLVGAARVDDSRQNIEKLMKEGYIATIADREELNKDWDIVTGEGWE